MLVLSRHKGEDVLIQVGEVVIEVKLVEIRGDKARLGIDAPSHVVVHRREIYEAIQRERSGEDERLPDNCKARKPSPFRPGRGENGHGSHAILADSSQVQENRQADQSRRHATD